MREDVAEEVITIWYAKEGCFWTDNTSAKRVGKGGAIANGGKSSGKGQYTSSLSSDAKVDLRRIDGVWGRK